MLADRNDDLAALIDANRGAGPLEPRTEGDLNDRNGEQHDKEDDHCPHDDPPHRPDLTAEVSINGYGETRIRLSLTKLYTGGK
jgi:hypothetical protein